MVRKIWRKTLYICTNIEKIYTEIENVRIAYIIFVNLKNNVK